MTRREKILAALGGAIGIIGSLWAFGDWSGLRPILKSEFGTALAQVQEQIDANTEYRYIERFKYLLLKRDHGGLTIEEQKELCALAEILNFSVEGCA